MKKFNQVIQVEVSIDSIAQQLLDNLLPDFKHRELVVESIIGRALSTDKQAISHLYNSLNGYTSDINFIVGENVNVDDMNIYGYWVADANGDRPTKNYQAVKTATIVSIDKYADNKVEVKFLVPKKDGEMETVKQWINHTKCSKIA